MTQTLDVHARVAEGSIPRAAPAAPISTTKVDRFGTFAITFGIAFVILYTLFERMNWPLFTFHPAVSKVDFWMHAARNGEGPPMYWYGWIALTLPCAFAIAFAATLIPDRLLQRITLFCCTLAVLWPVVFNIWVWIANRPSYDNGVTDLVWYSGIPALIGAGVATYLVPAQKAERFWAKWLVILPVGALVILGYSLKPWFTK
jgi:hypothetical protein